MVAHLFVGSPGIAIVVGTFAIFLGAIFSVSNNNLPQNNKLLWWAAIFLLPVMAPRYWLLSERKRHTFSS